MSVEGGQVLRGARGAQSKVIWLPSASNVTPVALPQQAPGDTRARPAGAAVHAGRIWRTRTAATMLGAATVQAVALTLFAGSGQHTEPWTAAAVFGLGTAVASGLGALVARMFKRRSRAAAGGILSYDALTLALVAAAAPVMTAAGAVLLLPAITALALAMRRISLRRAGSEREAFLLLAVLIALTGICEGGGWHAWTAAAAALVVGIMLQSGQAPSLAPPWRPHWHVWMKTSLLCVVIASTMLGRAGAIMLAAAPGAALLALLAGLLYGAGAGIACQMRSRRLAAMGVAGAPLLAAALLAAEAGTFALPKVAAALLLAAALVLSRRGRASGPGPLARPLGCPGGGQG